MAIPILGTLLPILDKVLDRAIPDPAERRQMQLELAKLADAENEREHKEMLGQIGINTEEAKSGSLFVAGWRPFIGWTGGVGLAYSFVLEPFSSWIAKVVFGYGGDFPALDTSQLMTLVMGMLGFGGLRAYEKMKGVAREELTANEPIAQVPAPQPKKKVLGVQWPF